MSTTIASASRAALLAALCASCSSQAPREPAPPRAPAAAAPAAKPSVPGASVAAPALVLTPPPEWVVETPSSAMRKAQYRLPRAERDGEDASLVVYFFGGQGGSREANLDRWASQFVQPDGSSSAKLLESFEHEIAGLAVFEAALSGTYVAETAPGSGERLNKPDWRMLAAIVETREGPWYFKLVGPSTTVAKWEPSYRAFLDALKPGS